MNYFKDEEKAGSRSGLSPVSEEREKHAGAAKNSNLRRSVEDGERLVWMSDFLKRSVSALCALARDENVAISRGLANFKDALFKEASLDEMEKSLSELKNAIAHCDDQPAEQGGDWGVNELRGVFLTLISEFDHELGDEFSGRVTAFREQVERAGAFQDLLDLRDEVLWLVREYNRSINVERNQVTDFITEISSGLIEVERLYVNSLNHGEQSRSENNTFNNILENHLEDMRKSAQLSTTLAEFKGMVMSRLATIRTTLEEKRRAEALRQEIFREELDTLNQNLDRMKKEIDQVQEKRKALEKQVLIDPLTGVANRRAFRERLKNELQRFQRYGHFFSIMMYDIDEFKSINDVHGHWAGDKCLKEIIKRIKPILRETDFMARWGGDEFILIFPGTDIHSSTAVAERIRKMVANTRFIYNRQEIALKISVGVTEVQAADATQEQIFNRVDKAMYKAKKGGRNRVETI